MSRQARDGAYESFAGPPAEDAFNASPSGSVSMSSTPFASVNGRAVSSASNNNTNTNTTSNSNNGAAAAAKGPRQRIPNRVYDYKPEDLYLAVQYSEEDVLAAIDATKIDRYLERMARHQLGDDHGVVYGGHEEDYEGHTNTANNSNIIHNGADTLNHSRVSAATAEDGGAAKGKIFTQQMMNVGLGGSIKSYGAHADGGEPPVNGDIGPYVRPPRRLNPYKSFTDVLLIVLPFGVVVPMVVLCAILIGYMYAKVRLCGYGCDCDASDIALITFTFGLIRDLPCSVVFACLTEACIEHQRSAAQTTRNRKSRQEVGGMGMGGGGGRSMSASVSIPRPGIFGNTSVNRHGGFQPMGGDNGNINGTSDSRFVGQGSDPSSPSQQHAAFTYGPYILEGGIQYLRRKSVLALIVCGQLWVMLYRAFADPIGIPEKAQLAVLLAVKILPFCLYAFAKKKIAAVTSVCILIVMPILIELVTEKNGGTAEGDNRDLWTGFFPLLVMVCDRFFLFALNATTHPSRSVAALVIFCTMHAFFSQNLMLGVALTIKATDHGGLLAGYAVSFAVIEVILNTVLIERIYCSIWRKLKDCFGSGASAKKALVDPLGKYSVPNIAAMVRLPTLLVSFIFMLPAMHFEYYPQCTKAIDCDGRTHYETSWPTYGVLGGVLVFVAIVTCGLKFLKGTSNVPLCVNGIAWCIMVGFYCLQVVPQSLSFLPLMGGGDVATPGI